MSAYKRTSIASLVFIWLIVGVLVFGWFKRQEIYDWARLRNYTPPANIAQLAADTTMNASAERIFYVNHPELENQKTFSSSCGSVGEQTIVLGCYIPPQR